jgi:hypothetical protein
MKRCSDTKTLDHYETLRKEEKEHEDEFVVQGGG